MLIYFFNFKVKRVINANIHVQFFLFAYGNENYILKSTRYIFLSSKTFVKRKVNVYITNKYKSSFCQS